MNRPISKENKILVIILIGVIFYIYGFIGRIQLFEQSYLSNKALNQWDPIFGFVTNIYVQNYFITPIIFFLSIKTIQENSNPYLIIRSGTVRRWCLHTTQKFSQKIGLILLLQLIVSLLLTIGTPIEVGWSNFAKNTDFTDIASVNFSNIVSSPIFTLFIQLFVFVLGYLTLHLVLTSFYLIKKKLNWLLVFSILLWLYTILSLVWFRGRFPSITIMNFLNWFVGSQVSKGPYFSIILGLFYFILFIGITMLWDFNFHFLKGKFVSLRSALPKKTYLVYFTLIILSVFYSIQQARAISINEAIVASGLGSSNTIFHFMFYLSYLLIFYGVVYLNLLYIDKVVRSTSYYHLVRSQSTNKYYLQIFVKLIQHVIFFLVLFLGIIIMVSTLVFSLPMSTEMDTLPIYNILYHFFMNHFLQILFYILFSVIIYFIFGELLFSIVLLVVLSFLLFPPFNRFLFIPIGLNSFSYLLEGYSAYLITLILLVYIAIEIAIIYYLFNYKDLR